MYEDCLSKKKSEVYGLKWIPSIEPKYNNGADYVELNIPVYVAPDDGNGQFTTNNFDKTLEEFLKIKDDAKCIFEIGVARNFERSSTVLWLSNKKDETHYFGIDIDMENKKHHEDYNLPNLWGQAPQRVPPGP